MVLPYVVIDCPLMYVLLGMGDYLLAKRQASLKLKPSRIHNRIFEPPNGSPLEAYCTAAQPLRIHLQFYLQESQRSLCYFFSIVK